MARELFDKYVKEAKFYRDKKRKHVRGQGDVIREDMSGRPKEPDIKFLRSVEERIPVTESESETYRGEILEFMASNPDFRYETYYPLAQAVERKLLADSKSTLTLVLASDKPKGDEEKKRVGELFSELTGPGGFCEICAKEIVEKAAEFLNK